MRQVYRVLPLFLVVCAFSGQVASGNSYNASLGSLPTDQGWALYDTSGTPVYVDGGALHQGYTSYTGYQFWYRNDQSFDFESGVTISMDLKIDYASYLYSGGYAYGGYSVDLIDNTGRDATFWMCSGWLWIGSYYTGESVPYVFDNTSGFHHYNFTVAQGIASLYVDYGADPVLTRAVGAPAYGEMYYNRVDFGDGTSGGYNMSQLQRLSYGAVPEPLTMLAVGMGIAGLGGYVRRRHEAMAIE